MRGESLTELCQVAAAAMLAACGARAGAGPAAERTVTLAAADPEGLLVAWLEEVLYSLEVRQGMPTDIRLSRSGDLELHARWREVPLAGVEKPIKAVTYHQLAVVEVDGGLEATIVFDV